MDYANNFVADRVVRNKAYPALARWQAQPYTAEWREFVQHWPNTVPAELYEHFNTHGIKYKLSDLSNLTSGAYYTVGLGFFNFDVDYFALMTEVVRRQLRREELTVLFYYHEGDNPFRIKDRLDELCQNHLLPPNCYRFVSGNTAANGIPGFVYFPDHELLYWHRNQQIPPTPVHTNRRLRDFTVLSRTHKWWRATVMTDLHREGLLDNSYWSYGTDIVTDEAETDNPIEVDTLEIREDIKQFLSNGPYTCDALTHEQHNDHHLIETNHFTDSYCNIVLETHFDADGSGGAFLTEKTFKAIKHGQPFVVVGCPGSLSALRDLGYRTFDHVVDNSYDTIQDNTERWIAVRKTIAQLKSQDLHTWFESCRSDVEHNQQLFCSSKAHRLNTLLERIHND
jgi:hypothetical protein